jgi:hypothetical protein
MSFGGNTNVELKYDKITFHTHPIPSYKKIGTVVAWPSLQDYITVRDMGVKSKQIVYHLLFTKEGMYFIVYDGKRQISLEDVKKNMEISYVKNDPDTAIINFLKKINTANNPIKTYFLPWGKRMLTFR